jgi:hypothetical protein
MRETLGLHCYLLVITSPDERNFKTTCTATISYMKNKWKQNLFLLRDMFQLKTGEETWLKIWSTSCIMGYLWLVTLICHRFYGLVTRFIRNVNQILTFSTFVQSVLVEEEKLVSLMTLKLSV